MKYAIYARVSTEEQSRSGYSIETQISILRGYCEDHGIEVYDVYSDCGASGSTSNRPELNRLLDDARHSKFTGIIFTRLDRWFRSVSQYYKIQQVLDECHITWRCAQEDYETETATGKFKVNIMLSVSQQYRDATSEKIKESNAERIRKGNYVSGSVCYGFHVIQTENGAKVVKDEKVSTIVDRMLIHYNSTNSIRSTLFYGQSIGFEMKYNSLRNMLRNPLLHGEYNGIKNFCEGYLSEEEHQSMIFHKPVRSNTPHTYIFSGLLRCPTCGKRMSGTMHRSVKRGKRYEYKAYRCTNGQKEAECGGILITQNVLERRILEMLQPEMEKHIIRIEQMKETEHRSDRDEIQEKMNRLNELYVLGNISEQQYTSMFNPLKRQLDETSANRNNVEKLKEIVNTDLSSFYATLSETEKRIFWRSVVSRINLNADRTLDIFFL